VIAIPIAGKTLRNLSLESGDVSLAYGVLLFVFAPLALTIYLAGRWALAGQRGQDGRAFASRLLLFATWFYFTLNFAFFRLPWPWESWTGRTPHALVYAVCSVGLTIAALWLPRTPRDKQVTSRPA